MVMPITHQWTAAAVRALIREDCAWPRYELLDGRLLVTPAPRSVHQFVIVELVALLYPYLEREPVGRVLTSPADIELQTETIMQPDVFVIPTTTTLAGDVLEWSDVKSLLLAIEVLSPSSEQTDRGAKRDHYLANGVDDYWIVDIDGPREADHAEAAA
jgi:Uma2 family endonuclease